MSAHTLIDGQPGDALPLADRGLQYGDGVFRTMLVCKATVEVQAQQLDKLLADARALGLTPPPRDAMATTLSQAASNLGQGVIKLLITAGDSQRGYARAESACRWLLYHSALPAWPAALWHEGIIIGDVGWPLSQQPHLAGLKHLNRLDQVMARRQLSASCQESLMRNLGGQPVCGGMSNLFWFADGHWHTPDLSQGGIAGLMRERILAALAQDGQPPRILNASDQALQQAELLLMCNSVIGLWPVREWRDIHDQSRRRWERPGAHPALAALRTLIPHPWQGEHV